MDEVKLKWAVFRRSSFSSSARDELMQVVWTEYYARLHLFVSLFGRQEGGNRVTDAEDIVQEIMVKVLLNLHSYNPRYSFATWIYAIARNHCRDCARKQRVRSRLSSDFEVADAPARGEGPEEALIRNEEEAITERFLTGLAERERQIAFLRFVEHQRYDDIGRILEIPSGTVKYRIYEIRKGLEHALETGSR